MLATILLASFMQGVVINEFSYDDSKTDDREYVELYNRTGSSVNMAGWKLASEDSTGPTVSYTLPANASIPPRGFYVIGATSVPNVNFVAGSQNLWGNSNLTLTLLDKSGKIVDTLLYEANKGVWAGARTRKLIKGDGVWGNFISIDLFETSWQRTRDGFTLQGNRHFGLYPWTPGKTNNRKNLLPYADNFDAGKVGAVVNKWGSSFAPGRIIDPTIADSDNTSAIKVSPQGGKAAIFWDRAGGGNTNMLVTDSLRNVSVEAWVYFDAKPEQATFFETWSLGVTGSTGTFYNTPDPSGVFKFNANGNTGVTATYQVTDKGGMLYLIDHNDGGWGKGALTKPKILGKIAVKVGQNDGWQRLKLTVAGGIAELYFGGTFGCGDGARLTGRLSTPTFGGGVYIGYREFIKDNKTARPFTCDDLRVTIPTASLSLYGTAAKTTKGTPAISADGLPVLGSKAFAVTATGLGPTGVNVVLLGATRLNVDLGAIGGVKGSRLLVSPLLTSIVISSSTGGLRLPVPLPCDKALNQVPLLWQVLDLDSALNIPFPFGTSEGLVTTLGF